jgi:aminoglycoside phosphotransferase family enzyme/predicted kinase
LNRFYKDSIHPEQAEVIQAMLKPETYPEPPVRITHLQTHISHIFLTGGLVYKIKKAVQFDFLDFSTLPKRGYYCRQEVMLNRRLTQRIYLRVVKITSENGRPVINGKGPVLEYAVLMREMPQERMMNRMLLAGEVEEKAIRAIVRKLVPFYRQARTGEGIDPFGQIGVIKKNTEENFFETKPYINRLISRRDYHLLASETRNFLRQQKKLFQQRISEGFIRDCHGDLHSANICLDQRIQIYDCIEFNHRFRYSDVASDLAFLSMDLDFHGVPHLSDLLIKEYVRLSGDRNLPRVLNFYKSYRAYVRAKIHSFTAHDPEIAPGERREESRLAKKYYHLALHYIQYHRPILIVVFGLMGSGKTALAQELARQTGWLLYSSDEIRKTLVGLPPTARKWESFGKGIYGDKISRKTYRMMREEAEGQLRKGRSVILDGSYKRQAERLALVALGEKTKVRIRFLECRAPLKVIRKRLDRRRLETAAVSDGRWEIFHQQRRDFDPLEEPIKSLCRSIRTIEPPESLVARLRTSLHI